MPSCKKISMHVSCQQMGSEQCNQSVSAYQSGISHHAMLTPLSVNQTIRGSYVCRQLAFTPSLGSGVPCPTALKEGCEESHEPVVALVSSADQSVQQCQPHNQSEQSSITPPSALKVKLSRPCCSCRKTVLHQNLLIRSLRRQVTCC